jgi:hypothetical protein
MAKELRFRSGVGAPFIVPLLAMCVALAVSQSRGLNAVSLVALGLVLGFMIWLLANTAYTVTDRGVLVQSGPVRRWVDATLIERVRPSKTVLSAPALSSRRLEISGGFGVVVVSPHDHVGFVRALKRAAPQLRLEGGLEQLEIDSPAQDSTQTWI